MIRYDHKYEESCQIWILTLLGSKWSPEIEWTEQITKSYLSNTAAQKPNHLTLHVQNIPWIQLLLLTSTTAALIQGRTFISCMNSFWDLFSWPQHVYFPDSRPTDQYININLIVSFSPTVTTHTPQNPPWHCIGGKNSDSLSWLMKPMSDQAPDHLSFLSPCHLSHLTLYCLCLCLSSLLSIRM